MAELFTDLKNPELGRGPEAADQPSISPRRLRALIRQGSAAARRKDWRGVVWFYGLVTEASPSLLAIQVQLGHALKELGDFDRAGRNYHAVLTQTPDDDDLHLQIGHLEKLKGNPERAAAYYRRAAELNPNNTDALVEYHGLATKLGLPPLPPSSVFDDQHLVTTAEKRIGPHDVRKFFGQINREDPVTGLARRIGNQHALRIAQRVREVLVAPGTTLARRIPMTDALIESSWPLDAPKRSEAANGPAPSRSAIRRPKALFVSDSLGTPIHARGIYHYSIALAEILNDIGFEITLVVQKSPGYGLERRTPTFRLSSDSIDTYQSAEIHRYFNDNIFSFRWKFENFRLQKLVERYPAVIRVAQRIFLGIFPRYNTVVNNLSSSINFIPSRGRHLTKFHRFLYIDRFYSASMECAVNDLDPPALNATGYDLVVIDTPHYARVRNINRSHVFTVIHDLIPLHDALYEQGWRRIFLAKMRATLALRGNLIFVSEYTRSLFRSVFPRHASTRQLVLYPSIPKDWIEQATPAKPRARCSYLSTISRDRIGQRREQIRARAVRVTDDPDARASLVKQLEASLPIWNSGLPYFVTVTSDEPRKNIRIFSKTAPRFIGKANFVIIGQVDGNRHMNHEPELYPNLHFTGYLDDADKSDLIRHAAGVIFPSFTEGFGIPIVEGALFEVPVICSNLKVFHEVTQNLALYFNPNSSDELVMRIDELLANRTAYAESARQLREVVLARFSQPVMKRRLQEALLRIGIQLPAGVALAREHCGNMELASSSERLGANALRT